jgi:glycosyltransferase involved in cell wall biosynthesis
MNNSPLVSIVIPCYNHEKYVAYTLSSILDDTYPNKEIVIINDGSTDNSDDVIRKWISQYDSKIPVTYKNRENRGICKTLNELLDTSNGKYVLPVASDDALYGNTIEQRVRIMESNEQYGKLVLIGDALVIDENNNITGPSSMAINAGNKLKFKTDNGILAEMIDRPSTVGPISFINKSIYSKIGYYPEDLSAEDWFFYPRAASIKAILFWDNIVAKYRVHSGNVSGRNISIKQSIKNHNVVRISIFRNIRWFPGLYFKLMGIKKLLKIQLIILKLNLQKLILD